MADSVKMQNRAEEKPKALDGNFYMLLYAQ